MFLRSFILFIIGFLGSIYTFAQTQNNRKVGVNTRSPLETLDVNGTLRVSDLPTVANTIPGNQPTSSISVQNSKYNGQEGKTVAYTPTKVVLADDAGVLGAVTFGHFSVGGSGGVGSADFFYLPPLALPINETGILAGTPSATQIFSYDNSSKVFKASLKDHYQKCFTFPTSSSSTTTTSGSTTATNTSTMPYPNSTISSNNAVQKPTKETNLAYFVSYYDDTVFSDVSIDNNGILSYKVKENSTPSPRTFMTILCKKQETTTSGS